jgi:hypothetical protein
MQHFFDLFLEDPKQPDSEQLGASIAESPVAIEYQEGLQKLLDKFAAPISPRIVAPRKNALPRLRSEGSRDFDLERFKEATPATSKEIASEVEATTGLRDAVKKVAYHIGRPEKDQGDSDEVGRSTASALGDVDDAECAPDKLNSDVRAVREVLRGKRLVIVGGDERPDKAAKIREAFELGELKWVATREHQSPEKVVPSINHSDTSVVLLLTRWCGHSHGQLKAVCDRQRTPFVQIPGGCNPRMLAYQIRHQVGEQLGICGND